jgi:hypothetical protein
MEHDDGNPVGASASQPHALIVPEAEHKRKLSTYDTLS